MPTSQYDDVVVADHLSYQLFAASRAYHEIDEPKMMLFVSYFSSYGEGQHIEALEYVLQNLPSYLTETINREEEVDLGNGETTMGGYAVLSTPDENVTVEVLTYYNDLLMLQIIVKEA